MTTTPSEKDLAARINNFIGAASYMPRNANDLLREALGEITRLRERCEVYKGQVKFGSEVIDRLRATSPAAAAVREADQQVFTASGTWTKPSAPLPLPLTPAAEGGGACAKWQPIETAPLAEMVWLWNPVWRHAFPGQRNGDFGHCFVDTCEPKASGWQAVATHWMPMSTPENAAMAHQKHPAFDKDIPPTPPAPSAGVPDRFKHFAPDGGKPKIPEGWTGGLEIKTSYERAVETEMAHQKHPAFDKDIPATPPAPSAGIDRTLLAEVNAIFGNLLTDVQSMGMEQCGLAIGPVGKARLAILALLPSQQADGGKR